MIKQKNIKFEQNGNGIMTKIIKRLKLYDLNRNRKSNCLILCSVTEKRHDDQGYSYKIKHVIEASLRFQRLSALSSWQGA